MSTSGSARRRTEPEREMQPLSGGGAGGHTAASATRSTSRTHPRRLLTQVSIRAQNALGLRQESQSSRQKWNDRRLRMLAVYGNLKVSKLQQTPLYCETVGRSGAEQAGQVRTSLINRQLSLTYSASADAGARFLVGSAPPQFRAATASFGATAEQQHRTPATVDSLDGGGFGDLTFEGHRRQNALRVLYRGARSLSIERRHPTSARQGGAVIPTTVPEESPPHQSPDLDLTDYGGVGGVGTQRVLGRPRPSDATRREVKSVFLPSFMQATEELARRSQPNLEVAGQGDLPLYQHLHQQWQQQHKQQQQHQQRNEVMRNIPPVWQAEKARPIRSPNLLSRLRVSCFANNAETNKLVDAIDDSLMFRPFFTYWLSAVHLIIFIATLIQFGFAPVGITLLSTRSATVVNRNMLSVKVCAIDYHNLFIGPRMSDLIKVGAKYSICMRRYEKLHREILDRQRRAEAESGCCIHNDGSVCYQSQSSGCPAQMSTWLKWTNSSPGPDGRTSGPVCGQDPRTCEEPRSLPGGELAWPDSIVQWPACVRQPPVPANSSFLSLSGAAGVSTLHLLCPISARPCCVGIKGECVITSQERCSFMRGTFFHNKQLCSQVNCLSETCGMLGVANPQKPNQFYRIFTSLFLHSGVITMALTLVHHLLFLRKLEQGLGWHKTALIYIGSGVIGNLASMIFLPFVVDVGPISAQIGSLAPLLIVMGMDWKYVDNKARRICLFIAAPLVLVLFGFFPWFDNFANLGGLVSGVLLSIVLMPYMGDTPRALTCRRITVTVCLTAWLGLLVGLCLAFYLAPPLARCDFCVYFNCGPKWFDKYFTDQNYVDYCGDSDLGNLEPTRCMEKLAEQMS